MNTQKRHRVIKAIILLSVSVMLVITAIGCGEKATKKNTRKIDLPAQIIGDWIVKDPPKSDTDDSTPKGNVPISSASPYNLTFTSEGNFTLNLSGKSHQGTFIISGTTIQLIPTGKNYRFELGDTEEEDIIIGDRLVWTRASGQPAYTPPAEEPTNPTEPTTPSTPTTPTPVPTPDSPVPPPPPMPGH